MSPCVSICLRSIARGMRAYVDEDFSLAISELRKAFRLCPAEYPLMTVSVARQLAAAHTRLEQLAEVEAVFRDALKFQSTSPQLHCDHALALIDLGRYADAERAARDAIRFGDDRCPDVYVRLALSLAGQDRPDEAMNEYHRALELGVSLGDALEVIDLAEARRLGIKR